MSFQKQDRIQSTTYTHTQSHTSNALYQLSSAITVRIELVNQGNNFLLHRKQWALKINYKLKTDNSQLNMYITSICLRNIREREAKGTIGWLNSDNSQITGTEMNFASPWRATDQPVTLMISINIDGDAELVVMKFLPIQLG